MTTDDPELDKRLEQEIMEVLAHSEPTIHHPNYSLVPLPTRTFGSGLSLPTIKPDPPELHARLEREILEMLKRLDVERERKTEKRRRREMERGREERAKVVETAKRERAEVMRTEECRVALAGRAQALKQVSVRGDKAGGCVKHKQVKVEEEGESSPQEEKVGVELVGGMEGAIG